MKSLEIIKLENKIEELENIKKDFKEKTGFGESGQMKNDICQRLYQTLPNLPKKSLKAAKIVGEEADKILANNEVYQS
jgi:hypothetical protein